LFPSPVKFFNYSLGSSLQIDYKLFYRLEWKFARPLEERAIKSHKNCVEAGRAKNSMFGLCGHRGELFAWKLIKSQNLFDRKSSHTHTYIRAGAYSGIMWHMFANHKYLIATCGRLCVCAE
jgi:hypothetical protein